MKTKKGGEPLSANTLKTSFATLLTIVYNIVLYSTFFLILTYDYAIAMHICECKLDSINDMQHVVKVCMEKVNWTINSDSKT